MRTKVYLCGPISAKDKKGEKQNMLKAVEVGEELLNAGFAPFVPHLSVVWDELWPGHEHQEWIEMDLPWVLSADCLLRMPGESKGSDIEVAFALEHGIPVYYSIEELKADPPNADHRFEDKLDVLKKLHRRKMRDYGKDDDPYANVRASAEWGLDPWIACMVRMSDKFRRLQAFVRTGHLANEGAEDSLQDIAVYCIIASLLLAEQGEK